MSNINLTGSNRFKRIPTTQTEYTANTTKLWSKKSLQIQVENKELRETDATLSSTPKHKRSIKPTDFAFLRFLGNGKFGSVYLAMYFFSKIGTSKRVSSSP